MKNIYKKGLSLICILGVTAGIGLSNPKLSDASTLNTKTVPLEVKVKDIKPIKRNYAWKLRNISNSKSNDYGYVITPDGKCVLIVEL